MPRYRHFEHKNKDKQESPRLSTLSPTAVEFVPNAPNFADTPYAPSPLSHVQSRPPTKAFELPAPDFPFFDSDRPYYKEDWTASDHVAAAAADSPATAPSAPARASPTPTRYVDPALLAYLAADSQHMSFSYLSFFPRDKPYVPIPTDHHNNGQPIYADKCIPAHLPDDHVIGQSLQSDMADYADKALFDALMPPSVLALPKPRTEDHNPGAVGDGRVEAALAARHKTFREQFMARMRSGGGKTVRFADEMGEEKGIEEKQENGLHTSRLEDGRSTVDDGEDGEQQHSGSSESGQGSAGDAAEKCWVQSQIQGSEKGHGVVKGRRKWTKIRSAQGKMVFTRSGHGDKETISGANGRQAVPSAWGRS